MLEEKAAIQGLIVLKFLGATLRHHTAAVGFHCNYIFKFKFLVAIKFLYKFFKIIFYLSNF
jgi:predicted tellurium resistance membrane protein TerC